MRRSEACCCWRQSCRRRSTAPPRPTSGTSQFVWAGLAPLNLSLCPGGCTLGCTLDVAVNSFSLSGPIPFFAGMIGAQFYVQGADFGALGGCAANAPFPVDLTTSDTVLTTIGS